MDAAIRRATEAFSAIPSPPDGEFSVELKDDAGVDAVLMYGKGACAHPPRGGEGPCCRAGKAWGVPAPRVRPGHKVATGRLLGLLLYRVVFPRPRLRAEPCRGFRLLYEPSWGRIGEPVQAARRSQIRLQQRFARRVWLQQRCARHDRRPPAASVSVGDLQAGISRSVCASLHLTRNSHPLPAEVRSATSTREPDAHRRRPQPRRPRRGRKGRGAPRRAGPVAARPDGGGLLCAGAPCFLQKA